MATRHPSLRVLIQVIAFYALSASMVVAQSSDNANYSKPNIIPASPNAAALGKYGDIPVSPYTGIPSIDVPMYEIKAGDITVPISVSYHASGIRVSEEASRVGLGWALNAGGVITRSIINKNDFEVSPEAYVKTTTYELPFGPGQEPAGPGSSPYLQTGVTPRFANKSNPASPNLYYLDALAPYINGSVQYDYEPDQFQYNFLGYSGKFVLKRNGEAVLFKQEKIRFVPNANGSAWTVFTPDGFRYEFQATETILDFNNSQGGAAVSSWYLTKIISPRKEEVTFSYTAPGLNTDYIRPAGAYYETKYGVVQICSNMIDCQVSPDYANPVAGKQYSIIYLDNIQFKNGTVKFMYGNREDVYGDKQLNTIQIFRKGETSPIRDFLLSYSYFTSPVIGNNFPTTTAPTLLTKRLKLESLTERGYQNGTTESKTPYRFTYYEGDIFTNLPSKASYARDHWGYFNGRYSNTSLIPSYTDLTGSSDLSITIIDRRIGLMGNERESDPNYAKAFSLKQIEYPTRGRTEFQYETHDFDQANSTQNDYSYFGTKPTTRYARPEVTNTYLLYDARNKGVVQSQILDLTNEYVDEYGRTVPVTVSAAFRTDGTYCKNVTGSLNASFELLTESGFSYGTVTPTLTPCATESDGNCIYCDQSPNSQSPVFTYRATYNLPPGRYVWKSYIASTETRIQDVSANYQWTVDANKIPNAKKYEYGGGLRVSKITDYDDLNLAPVKIKKFIYRYQADKNNDGQMEEYSYGRRMVRPEYTYFQISTQSKDVGGNYTYICPLCTSIVRESDSNMPLNASASGSIVGYDQVTVLNGENGEFGKTIYEYENQSDIVRSYNLEYSGFTIPQRPPSIASLPYEKNGLLLRQTEFAYQGSAYVKVKETINQYSTPENKTVVYGIQKRIPQTSLAPTPNNVILAFYPAIQSNWIYMISTTERVYDQGTASTFAENKTEYYYTNAAHMQLTSTVQYSSEDKRKLLTEYTYPLSYSGTEADAVVNDMKSDTRYMHKAVVEKTVSQLKNNGTTDVKTILSRQFTKYGYFSGTINGTTSATAYILPKEIVALEIDQPTDPATISAYKPAVTYDATRYKTRLTFDYNADGNVQLVQKAADVSTVFLWAYYKSMPVAEIVNATVSQVNTALTTPTAINFNNTNGTPLADTQMRAQLSLLQQRLPGAKINTYTYDPLKGITSQTTADGVVTFYEYDALGRLKLVRDQDSKIIKSYTYHYKE